MMKRERRNELEICELVGIKIRHQPVDTIAQSVERRRDMRTAWIRILASVRFLFVPLRSFFSATIAKRCKVQFRQGFA